jgi:hypothetical protein
MTGKALTYQHGGSGEMFNKTILNNQCSAIGRLSVEY